MNTSHRYLSGILISDPTGSVSARGTPGVQFTLREESEDQQRTASFWCFVADLWPTILGCRRGDALSVIGRLRKRNGVPPSETDGHAEFTVRRVLSVRRRSMRTSHVPDLSEA